jgi:hypothetical protein
MRKKVILTIAVVVVALAGLALSTPAVAAGAREALAGLTDKDDAVVHDNGNVSICKNGKFPGCKGGRAFHCPKGGQCTETPPNRVTNQKPGRPPVTGILGNNPGMSATGPGATGKPVAPSTPPAPSFR